LLVFRHVNAKYPVLLEVLVEDQNDGLEDAFQQLVAVEVDDGAQQDRDQFGHRVDLRVVVALLLLERVRRPLIKRG